MAWKPFNGCFSGNDYFLIRKIGNHPATGRKLLPIVAQLIGGDLYTSDNELEPLSWADNDQDGHLFEQTNPFKANLEWMPIPE